METQTWIHTERRQTKEEANREREGGRRERANKTARVKWGEENERQMANNVMREIRVCDGYLVC